MRDKELDGLYKAWFNLGFSDEVGYERSMGIDAEGLMLGEKRLKLISMQAQGSIADQVMRNGGVASPFIFPLGHQLMIPHILSCSFRIENREKELRALDLDKKLNASLDYLSGQDNEIKSAEIDEFTAGVRVNNEQLISLNLSLILWDRAVDELGKAIEKGLAAFRMLAGAEGWVETMDTANLFFALAPGNGFQNYRWLLMRARNALCYFHLSGNYKSEKEGVRLFSSDLNNQNTLVIGPSGSGKSFTVDVWRQQKVKR